MKLLYSLPSAPTGPCSILALVLAAINQVFSLLDPYIFRKIIDQHVVKPTRRAASH